MLFAVLLSLGSVIQAQRKLEVETDLVAFLPRDSAVANTTRRALDEFGGFDFMYAVLEAPGPGHEEELMAAAEVVADSLRDRTFFRTVNFRLRPDEVDLSGPEGRAQLVALMTESDWNTLEQKTSLAEIDRNIVRVRSALSGPVNPAVYQGMSQDPLNLSSILRERVELLRGPLKLNLNRGHFLNADGSMLLILLWPAQRSTDLLFANNLRNFVEATRESLFQRNPQWNGAIAINFYGKPIEATLEANQLREDARRTALLSSLFVIICFAVVFRRPEALVFTLLPVALGFLWTLGLTSTFIGRLTQITAMFGAILIGTGVDFSVHVYNRFLEEVRNGVPVDNAVQVALETTMPATVAGAFTTSIAFFAMSFTKFVGFRELGMVVGLGVLLCLLASMLVLPVSLRTLGRIEARNPRARILPTFGLRRASFLVKAYPRLTLLCCAAIVTLLAANTHDIVFDKNFRNLRPLNAEYSNLRSRIENNFQTPSSQVIIVIEQPTLEQALRANDRLYRNLHAVRVAYPILAIDSLRPIYPSVETQRQSLERLSRFNVDLLQTQMDRVATEKGLSPSLFAPFLAEMRSYRMLSEEKFRDPNPVIEFGRTPQTETFNAQVQRYVYRAGVNSYRIMTQVYPPKGQWEDGLPEAFLDAVKQGIHPPPEVTGLAVVSDELRRIIVRDLAFIVIVTLTTIVLFLVYYFRSITRALLALLPIGAGLLATLGIARLMGLHLNYLNIIALPVIVGLGIDAGIHLLQRYYESEDGDLRVPIERTGRAIVLSSLSTAFGFASLITAGFVGIRELGVLILVGVLSTMLATVLMLPAMLRVMREHRMLFVGGPGDDLG